jgi:hypothetical protein
VILIGLFIVATLCVLLSANALDDAPPRASRDGTGGTGGYGWLLFGLCLLGVLAHQRKKQREAEDD